MSEVVAEPKRSGNVLGWTFAGVVVVLALVAWVLQEGPARPSGAPTATVNANQTPAGPQATDDAGAQARGPAMVHTNASPAPAPQ